MNQINNHYQACAARLEAAAREIESMRAKATPKPASKAAPKKTTAAKPTNGNN